MFSFTLPGDFSLPTPVRFMPRFWIRHSQLLLFGYVTCASTLVYHARSRTADTKVAAIGSMYVYTRCFPYHKFLLEELCIYFLRTTGTWLSFCWLDFSCSVIWPAAASSFTLTTCSLTSAMILVANLNSASRHSAAWSHYSARTQVAMAWSVPGWPRTVINYASCNILSVDT